MSESKTFTAVILPSVEEQLAMGDTEAIDPTGVDLTEWESGDKVPSPLFRNFSYAVDDIIGIWKNPRVEDGRLVADIRLQEPYDRLVREDLNESDVRFATSTIHGGGQARLIAVSATWAKPPAEKA